MQQECAFELTLGGGVSVKVDVKLTSGGRELSWTRQGNVLRFGDSGVLEAPLRDGSQSFQLKLEQAVPGARLEIRLLPSGYEAIPWLTLPGLFYGDNLKGVERSFFPRDDAKAWSFRADASPCPGLHLPGVERGWGAFLSRDRADCNFPLTKGYGDVMGVGWAFEGGLRCMRLSFPASEVPEAFHRYDRMDAPLEPAVDLPKGAMLSFTLRHFVTAGGRQAYFQALRVMAKSNRSPRHSVDKNLIHATAGLFAGVLKTSHFKPGRGFSHQYHLDEIHSGWCGGFAAVEAGLAYGRVFSDPDLAAQAGVMGDFLCREAPGPLGIFRSVCVDGQWKDSVHWAISDGFHMRNPAEGCLFLSRLLRSEGALGRPRKEWSAALEGNLNAVLKMMGEDGLLPLQFDAKTGKGIDYDGATPGLWAGSLAALGGRHLEAARKVGAYYLQNYVAKDLFYGGPYDTYKAPNMEDAYGLLISYLELNRHDPDTRWIEAARDCADHLLSWQYAYDVEFPEGTICSEMGISTYGMAPASVRNRHLQNWETVAASALHELSDKTGDPEYAERALLNLQQSCQMVERGDGRLGIPLGGQSEQWYATDMFTFGDHGNYGKGNMWKCSVALPKVGFLNALAAVPEWSAVRR